MAKRIIRSDAPRIAQVTRLSAPAGSGEIKLTVLGSGKFLEFVEWNAAAVAAAWNASTWPEFAEAAATVSGSDVLLTSKLAGRPFYVAASVGGNQFANEKQTITPVNVTGGTTQAIWQAQTTTAFNPVTAAPNDLKTMFEALAGGIVASGELIWTGIVGGPWTVEFGGRYAEQHVPLITLTETSLTGGTAAKNEKQRLSMLPGATDPVAFQLRRPDDLQTTAVLTTPLTASACAAALASIGYSTTCTGGDLKAGGSDTQWIGASSGGRYNATTVINAIGTAFTTSFGQVPGDASISRGLLLFSSALPQGQHIDHAELRLWFTNYTQDIAGVNVRAALVPNASWPASVAAANANTLTTASVTFDVAAGVGTGVGFNQYIDVTTIMQEVVNQSGWASGHAVLFYIIPPATTHQATYQWNGAGIYVLPLLLTTTSTSGAPILIEWTGADAAKGIPELLVVPEGGYTLAPVINTVQNGAAATLPQLDVEITVAGGESLRVRDDVRSRGPEHYDDPLNHESDDGTWSVPETGDSVFIESGKGNLLYGLKQRSAFVALTAMNKLRMTEVHHWWIGQAVQVTTTDTLPGGLAANTTYYIAAIDGPYVTLSATRGGVAITLTTAGAGVHTIGVKLALLEIQSRWVGRLGLPRLNNTANLYFEYRERYLELWCDLIKLGTGAGGGSSRINLDTGVKQTKVQAITSAGQAESGVNAILWKGTHVDNDLEVMQADFGIAIFPEEVASFDELRQRGGTITLGRGVTGGSIDATSGSRISLGATIAGQLILS